jgi:DEAD/DEAH box helicase domain-containing protein
MFRKKSLTDLIQQFKSDAAIGDYITHWHTINAKEARTVPFPEHLDQRIQKGLRKRGITQLYTHQGSAFEATLDGEHMVAVTPTASGKTLCYNLPVLQAIAQNPHSRAIYLFPTKALAQDQKSELNEMISEIGIDIKSYTYDGDTPANVRQLIRQAGHVVMTNPDMLHSGILPHHTKWVSLFENLRYIIIDELHIYRGVFGSHVANVLRRLLRICRFYGSEPRFICTSATIANPRELAEQLTGQRMRLIDNNGAPTGVKHIVFYNPPIINKPLNIRKSATLEVKELARQLLSNDIQTIVFARSRVRVEILLNYLKDLTKHQHGPKSIRAYRGGYLPQERREIEQGLRNGEIMGVVSTNALELGVDIGQLQACILTGYPGSVASTWQQAGRAGRRQGEALIIMVASSNPIDQYIIQHPDYFFNRNPEKARIQPDNLIILVDHIKCAAYELPFSKGECFGDQEIEEILHFLSEERILIQQHDKWYWMNDAFPAHNISLRSASQENVVIIDISETNQARVIGEMDRFSAMTLLHDEAIYLHQGVQYQVEKLDYEEKKAFVREVTSDYFTDANLAVQLKVLEIDSTLQKQEITYSFGDVTVNAMATLFKKIKFETHENIGSGPIHLPEEELHTSAVWISIPPQWEKEWGKEKLSAGLVGLAHVLNHVAPLFVMCDSHDLHVVPQMKAIHNDEPTLFIYDRYPGGIGLSEQLFKDMDPLLQEALALVNKCPCQHGCPSCIGFPDQPQIDAKKAVKLLIRLLLRGDLYVTSA